MTTAEEWEGEDAAMEAREAWEDDEAQRQLQLIRLRRHALEDFAATLPALIAAAPSEDARAQIQPLADRLNELLRNFHMNNLDEMERLKQEIHKLAQAARS
jgi:hypothetical protein